MQVATLFRSFSSIGHPGVDAAGGVIRGVSIISQGEARGHEVFVDLTTLMQVKACAESRGRAGLACKFNPTTFDHGPGGIAGHFDNFRISGSQLLADLYIERTFPAADYLLALAANQPGSFGLSIDFDMAVETMGGREFARCQRIDAATVVDAPAANTGLFSINHRNQTNTTMSNLRSASATVFASRISTLQTKGLSRGAAIQRLAADDPEGFNKWSAAGRPDPAKPGSVTTSSGFNGKVREFMRAGKGRAEAIIVASGQHPTAFAAWCSEGRPSDTAPVQTPATTEDTGGKWLARGFRINR